MDFEAWCDQQDAHTVECIRRYGWCITIVGSGTCSCPGCHPAPGDEPPFAYTTGLFGLGHPELLVVGMDPEPAVRVLNDLGERIREGGDLVPGVPAACDGWPYLVVPEPVPNPGEILFEANHFYGRLPEDSVPALQLAYADRAGRFPWDEDYADPDRQPRPGTFTAWGMPPAILP